MDGNAAFSKTLGRENPCQHQLVIVFPDCRVLRLFARSLLLAFAVLAMPWLRDIPDLGSVPDAFPSGANSGVSAAPTVEATPEDLIPAVFRDLLDQGLLNVSEYALFIGGSSEAAEIRAFVDGGAIPPLDIVDEDEEGCGSIVDGAVDFAFTANGFNSVPLIGRILRVGGVAALLFSSGTDSVKVPPNFKIVYLRRFRSSGSDAVIAIRKMNEGDDGRAGAAPVGSTVQGAGLCPMSDAKRRAIRALEDILLEPPRKSWVGSRGYLKQVRYLPDLIADDLASYSRHVYVEVGQGRRGEGVGEWFLQNYPARGQDFDVYALEGDVEGRVYEPTVTWTKKGGPSAMGAMGIPDWLKRNVGEEEFVVMKIEVGGGGGAEFEVVREMVRSKAVCLVDELFLVCEHEEKEGGKRTRIGRKRSRAYWECLALYGMLREEGVAVHQWWG